MRIWLIGMAVAATLGSVADAQAQTQASRPSSSSAGRGQGAGKSIDGVTVTAPRLKACGEHDTVCIQAVAKTLWTEFPRQIDAYCIQQKWAHLRQAADFEEFFGASAGGSGLGLSLDGRLPPALEMVCGAKPKDDAGNLGLALDWAPWEKVPSEADLAAAFPKTASPNGGAGDINCAMTGEGHLSDCVLVAETSPGFGAAALKLSHRFKARVAKEPDHHYRRDLRINLAVRFPPRNGTGAAPLVNPDWIRTPDPAQAASLYPAAATKAGVATGVGSVTCRIDDKGFLSDCSVVSQDPQDLGFGAAALAVTPSLQANLWTREGDRAAGGSVTVPLRFDSPTPATTGD